MPDPYDAEKAIEGPTAATDKRAEAQRKLRLEQSLDAMSERGLRDEFKQTQRSIEQTIGHVDKLESKYKSLRAKGPSKAGGSVAHEERLEELRKQIVEGRAGVQDEMDYARTVRAAADKKGVDLSAPMAAAGGGGRGGFGGALSAFVGGAGMGGGSMGTLAMGAAGYGGGFALAIPAAIGIAVGKAIATAKEGYSDIVKAQQSVLPLGIMTGLDAGRIASTTREGMFEKYRQFSMTDIRAGQMSVARGTGRMGMPGVLDVAAVTGETPQEAAQRFVAMSRYEGRYDPYLSGRILGSYGRSRTAPTKTGPLRAGELPYQTTMYGQYSSQVAQLARSSTTPYTRVSTEGLGQELATATHRLRMPGIDFSTAGGLEVASNIVQGANAFVGKEQGGTLGDLQMMAVAQLRNNPDAVRALLKQDIDIRTVPGMLRAIQNAPRLAAEGKPQLAQALYGMVRKALPPDMAELALGETMDRNLAHLLVTQPNAVEDIWRSPAKNAGKPVSRDIATAAEEAASRPDVNRIYQDLYVPEARGERTGDLVKPLGDAITAGMNDIKNGVLEALNQFFGSGPVNVPLAPTVERSESPGWKY